MRKRHLILFCFILVLSVLICMAVVRFQREETDAFASQATVKWETIPGIPVESVPDAALETKAPPPPPETPEQLLEGLAVNGVTLPGTRNGVYYLTVDGDPDAFLSGSVWTTTCGGEVVLPESLMSGGLAEKISAGEQFTITVRGYDMEIAAELVLTPLPVMEITFHDGQSAADIVHGDDGEDVPCQITLTEAGLVRNLSGQDAGIHIRGGTARYYPKKSYKFSLLNERGNSYKTALLGMRRDDDWILLAGYTDGSKLREKLGMSIWQDMIADRAWNYYAYNLEHIELILDGEYVGLYLLHEPVDAKLLDLTDEQMLYKCRSWDFPDRETGEWGGFELKSPKLLSAQANSFSVLCDYCEFLNAGEEKFLASYAGMLDWEEVIDHYLFINYIYACDNKINNMYYVASPDENGLHIQFVPWDLDNAFGYSNWLFVFEDGSTEQCYLNRMPFTLMEEPHAVISLKKYAPEVYDELAAGRWAELRQTVLTADRMTEKVRELFAPLKASGAYLRDEAIWNEYFLLEEDEEEYLIGFLTEQLDCIDAILGYTE